jgi:hypothetical protein
MKVWPVARDTDSLTYEVPCPPLDEVVNAGCTGSITLANPPFGSDGPDTLYGSGTFDLEPGERKPVRVELTATGKQAVANGAPIDVRVDSDLSKGAGSEPDHAEAGWEQVLGPG